MAVDLSKAGTKGGDQGYNTGNIRGVREERGVVRGIVKANVHPTHMGVLSVYVPTFSTDESDKSQWRTVRYCTPFYSRVDSIGQANTYFGTKVTSGIVTPPPDLGTTVLCVFPEGRNAEGFYFACVPDPYMMQTLPESTLDVNGLPAGEFNDSNDQQNTGKITNWKSQQRPRDYFAENYLRSQGLTNDRVRGINNSGYMREAPSELIGISSKGRRVTLQGDDFTVLHNDAIKDKNTTDKKILDGLLGPNARRKGHSITLDDGDIDGASNQIRLRTSSGHQLLLNDSEGIIYIGNSDGSVWIELGSAGTVDIYAEDSINFRSKNLNFHAEDSIKFHSNGYTQLISDSEMHIQGNKLLAMRSDGEVGITADDNVHVNAGADFTSQAAGSAYLKAGANASINGALVLLQGPSGTAKTAKKINNFNRPDVEFNAGANEYDNSGRIDTTVDRIVTHEPFAQHGVGAPNGPFMGGLVGGGGPGAFSIISAGFNVAGATGAFAGATPIQSGGALGEFGGLGDSIPSGIDGGLVSAVSRVSETASSFTDFIPADIGNFIQEFSSNIDFETIRSTIDGVQADFGELQQFIETDLAQYVPIADAVTGGAASQALNSFTGVTSVVTGGLEFAEGGLDFAGDITQAVDKLDEITSKPNFNDFKFTDFVSSFGSGFSIGKLDEDYVKGLLASVAKGAETLNDPAFQDTLTKSVGKYGFNVDQLVRQGYVRPEAVFNDQLSDTSMWTGKDGMHSLAKFLTSPSTQEVAMQGEIAALYQEMVNSGAIKPSDSAEKTMAMLSAAANSTANVCRLVRSGEGIIEDVLQNTTNIRNVDDVRSEVERYMQYGFSAGSQITDTKQRLLQRQQTPTPIRSVNDGVSVSQANAQIAQLLRVKNDSWSELSPQQRETVNNNLIKLYALSRDSKPV